MTDQTKAADEATAPAPEATADPAAFDRRLRQCEAATLQTLEYAIDAGDQVRTVSSNVEILKKMIAEVHAAQALLAERLQGFETATQAIIPDLEAMTRNVQQATEALPVLSETLKELAAASATQNVQLATLETQVAELRGQLN